MIATRSKPAIGENNGISYLKWMELLGEVKLSHVTADTLNSAATANQGFSVECSLHSFLPVMGAGVRSTTMWREEDGFYRARRFSFYWIDSL